MRLSVDQRDRHVHHRIPTEDAAGTPLPDAGLHRRDELRWHGRSSDLVDEDDAGALLQGGDAQGDASILPAPACLANVAALGGGRSPDGLPIGDLRPAGLGRDLELPPQAVGDDVEVQLAHPGDDDLPALLIGVEAEGGVFRRERPEGVDELHFFRLVLRLHGNGDHRVRKLDVLQKNRRLPVAERIAGVRLVEPHSGHDIAGESFLKLLPAICVHAEQAADAL